jgi:hypothetical protein
VVHIATHLYADTYLFSPSSFLAASGGRELRSG